MISFLLLIVLFVLYFIQCLLMFMVGADSPIVISETEVRWYYEVLCVALIGTVVFLRIKKELVVSILFFVAPTFLSLLYFIQLRGAIIANHPRELVYIDVAGFSMNIVLVLYGIFKLVKKYIHR